MCSTRYPISPAPGPSIPGVPKKSKKVDIMKEKNKPFAILTVLLILVSIVWIVSAGNLGFFNQETDTFQEIYSIVNGTDLHVKGKNGDVSIVVWDEENIEVVAQKITLFGEDELEKVKIKVTNRTDFLVETDYIDWFAWVSVDFEIRIPVNVTVSEVKTNNGGIKLTGTRGTLSATTSNGEISIRDHSGDIIMESSNGELYANAVRGNVDGETSNGPITFKYVNGTATARTSNGRINVDHTKIVRKLITSNDPISANFHNISSMGTVIQTSNGHVKVWIPDNLDARLKIETSNGDIDTHITIDISDVSEDEFVGTLGNGGPKLSIKTSNGGIELTGIDYINTEEKPWEVVN